MMSKPLGAWPVLEPDYPVQSAAVLCEAVSDVVQYLNCAAFVEDGRAYLRRQPDQSPANAEDQFWTNALYVSCLITNSPEASSEEAEAKFSEMCQHIITALEQKMILLGVSETHKAIRTDDPEYGDTVISFVHRDVSLGERHSAISSATTE